MGKISKFKIIILISGLYLLFFAPARAAKLYFEPSSGEFASAKDFILEMRFDAEGEDINAIEANISFPQDILELKEIRSGNSILNFWVKKPALVSGQIGFSGIITGGYKGEKGLVLSMIFSPRSEGEGVFEIKNGKALLNDGKGTLAKLSFLNSKFSFSASASAISSGQIPSLEEDKTPPEDFKPEISQSPEIFNGKWFLAFITQDKGSGIDHYDVYESRQKKDATQIGAKDWTTVESPYVLKDQALHSYIYVRAVDKAGNIKIAAVLPRNPLKWYENTLIWGIIIILGIISVVSYIIIRKKRSIRQNA